MLELSGAEDAVSPSLLSTSLFTSVPDVRFGRNSALASVGLAALGNRPAGRVLRLRAGSNGDNTHKQDHLPHVNSGPGQPPDS